jgi:hypothetical protein
MIGCDEDVMNQYELRTINDAALHRLMDRLQRSESDFRERLAERLDALRDHGAPISDPLYQRIFFTLKRLDVQRAEADRELARRVVST